MSKDEFIVVVTDGQTAPPAYFSFDAALNKAIHPLFDELDGPDALTLDEVLAAQAGGAVVLDSRSPDEFGAGHLTGSINVGLEGRYSEFVGGIVATGSQIVIVAEDGRAAESKTRLARIGFDDVVGYLMNPLEAFSGAPQHVSRSSRVDVASMQAAMHDVADLQVVDVRQPGETSGGIIKGATVIPLTQLSASLDQLDPSKPVLIYCAGGFRSMIAASKLASEGFVDVTDLLGGYGAWTGAEGPTVVPAGV